MKTMLYNLLFKKKETPVENPKTFQDITNALNAYTHKILEDNTIPTKEEIESIKAMLEIAHQLSIRKDK